MSFEIFSKDVKKILDILLIEFCNHIKIFKMRVTKMYVCTKPQ